jgi:hypothetical protein
MIAAKSRHLERRRSERGRDMDTIKTTDGMTLVGKESRVVDQPFSVVQFDNVIAEQTFETLNKTFPEPDGRWDEGRGLDSKFFIGSENPVFGDIVGASSQWTDLLASLRDPMFWTEVGGLIHPIMYRHREANLLASALPSDLIASIDHRDQFLDILRQRTRSYFQFSHLCRDNLNAPHADDWRKIVSLIVYFPPVDWRGEYGGGTVFLRAKADLSSLSWYEETMNRVPAEHGKAFASDMEPFFRSDYRANACVLFCKTKNSFHAVEPIKCPASHTRRALVLGLKVLDE